MAFRSWIFAGIFRFTAANTHPLSFYHLHSIGLILHIIGITFIAGGCVGSIFTETHVWRQLRDAPYRTIVLLAILRRFPLVIYTGSFLLLVSGLMMLTPLGWVQVKEGWFIAKMVLYVLINLNGLLVAGPSTSRLVHLLPGLVETDPSLNSDLSSIRNRMRFFHFSTFGMLLAVYILSVYQ